MAYHSQSDSLIRVQRDAKGLEDLVRELTNGYSGNVKYGEDSRMNLQTDVVLPNIANPDTLISVTHSNPDIPGHSNENKLQLKLGELYLCKTYNPNYRCILVSGGTKEAWLSYVLKVFELFFDDVVYLWDRDFVAKLHGALNCPIRNIGFWTNEKIHRSRIRLSNSVEDAPFSRIRERFYDTIIPSYLNVTMPSEIDHPIVQIMAKLAFDRYNQTKGTSGEFWKHLHNGNYEEIWSERSYFNPAEAVVNKILLDSSYRFLGSVGNDVAIHNMLYNMGSSMNSTKVSEDFVLFSKKLNIPVFIQCKASGGGRGHHGKAIMNRGKEQIARSLLYRCSLDSSGNIISKDRQFYWIAILDGNWALPKKYPLKYINMLQIAGYDSFIGADSLLDRNMLVLENNSLVQILKELDCYGISNISSTEWDELMKRQIFPRMI